MTKFDSERRFGLEYEVLAFDGKSRPDQGQQPAGIQVIAMLTHKAVPEQTVEIRGYEHTDGNAFWAIKPDSSCGIEVCTPILKGNQGLTSAIKVAEVFSRDEQIKVDNRCSLHGHVEIADLTNEQIGTIIAYWIKIEHVFVDSFPVNRKQNRYCVPLGRRQFVQCETKIHPNDLVKKVGQVKYLALNTNQYVKNGRKTIEIRLGEGEACKDPLFVKCWTRLMIHFVEKTKNLTFPVPFENGNPWSSFLWLDPKDTFKLLGFYENLSPGIEQMRNWFLARLLKNTENVPFRSFARKETLEIIEKIKEKEGTEITTDFLTTSKEFPIGENPILYSDKYKN